MALLNKLFKKTKKEEAQKEPINEEKPSSAKATEGKKAETPKKPVVLESKILLSSHTAEKALSAQQLNQYVFKISSGANKIMVANEVKKKYNVKVLKVNVINVPKKTRRVGRAQGFRAGYKKAIVTLASGQSIELK